MNVSQSDLLNILCLSHGELQLPRTLSKTITKHLAKKGIDSVTVEIQIEIQQLSAAVGEINGLSAKMKLKYGQYSL